MPMWLAIICGLLTALLIVALKTRLPIGIKPIDLVIVLLPLYYSGRNLISQSRIAGHWTIRWSMFWKAFLLELIVVGFFGYFWIYHWTASKQFTILSLGAFITITAVAYGLGKKQDANDNP